MPVIKHREQSENERRRADSILRSNLTLIRSEGVTMITAAEVRRERMTLKQLFERVGLKSSQVADALPAADSTVRGFLTGRKEPSLPMSLQHRLLQQLKCDWETFRLAWQHSHEVQQNGKASDKVQAELEAAERDASPSF